MHIFKICSITSTSQTCSASLLRERNNSNGEFSYGLMVPWASFKGPVFLNHVFSSSKGSDIALSPLWYPPLGETDIRRSALLDRPCPCSGRAASNLSFSIWYPYYVSLMTERCCSNVAIVVDNGLDITLLSHALVVRYCYCGG